MKGEVLNEDGLSLLVARIENAAINNDRLKKQVREAELAASTAIHEKQRIERQSFMKMREYHHALTLHRKLLGKRKDLNSLAPLPPTWKADTEALREDDDIPF